MAASVSIVLAAVLATAEFCAAPIDGGTGNPQLCRLENKQEIETPYFSVEVDPDFLVGVHHYGRRLLALPSQHQSPLYLEIVVADRPYECPHAERQVTINSVTWHRCDEATTDEVTANLTTDISGKFIVARYSYWQTGAMYAAALEQMVQSIKVHAI